MKTDLPILRVLIMMSKSCLYGIFLTCLFSGVLLANNGNAQDKSVNDVFISLKLQEVTVRRALEAIQENTEFKFIFEEGVLKSTEGQRVTLEVDNESVAKVLKIIAEDMKLSFRQLNGSIVVKAPNPVKEVEESAAQEPILGQDISGKVTDESGEPLPGASVLVKGTNIGVITDADGNYRLSAPDDATTLVFSFVGYERQEVAINGRTLVDISLVLDVKTLGEVIVSTGYWDIEERANTGNIAKVTAKEIEQQPVANPLQALQGRMAGVYIQQSTGVPGSGFNIQIRGLNSLRNRSGDNGNLPLFVVDGVPFTSEPLQSGIGANIIGSGNPLNSLNPMDIESIEVLKDADATAIYGSRGSNGVVLITTKKGSVGKTKVDINFYSGVGKVSEKMDLLNTQQYLEMRNEAFRNDGQTPGSIFPDDDLLVWDTTRFTDWQDMLIGGTSNIRNAQVSVSGGSEQTQFLFGAGHYRETTVFPGDFDYQKYSANFNMKHSSYNGKFHVDLSANYVIENNNLLRGDLTPQALSLPPNAPAVYDEEGNLNWENGTWNNPFALLQTKFTSRTNSLVGNGQIRYQITEGLQLKANLGYTETQLTENSATPISSRNPFSDVTTGAASFSDNAINTWILEPQMEYETKLKSGRFSVLIGSTFQQTKRNGDLITGLGYASDALLGDIQAAPEILIGPSISSEFNYNAIFGRINYNWKEKYIINLTGRRDGSSRFGPGNQFANFGAIGAAWIFSEESFVRNLFPFLSFGKLRASYGTTGSDQIGDYRFLELWTSTRFPYDETPGLLPNNLFNPDFGWERNKKFETGIEFGVLKERINISASYYRNHSDNQLVGVPLPFTTGFSSYESNLPAEVRNTGVELEINTVNVNADKFNWTSSINLTIPRNELVSFPDIENSSFRNQYEVGKSLFIQKAFHYKGVHPETGIHTFEDVNQDDVISINDDLQALEEVAVEYFGGFLNTFSFKGLQLDVHLQFVKQTGFNYLSFFSNAPGSATNQPAFVMDRWQSEGDISNIQQFTQGFGDGFLAFRNIPFADNRIGDASFIRLRNVSLSYQLPSKLIDKINISSARVYITGQNLVTITDYIGLDPESQSTGFSLPPLQVLTGGIHVTF